MCNDSVGAKSSVFLPSQHMVGSREVSSEGFIRCTISIKVFFFYFDGPPRRPFSYSTHEYSIVDGCTRVWSIENGWLTIYFLKQFSISSPLSIETSNQNIKSNRKGKGRHLIFGLRKKKGSKKKMWSVWPGNNHRVHTEWKTGNGRLTYIPSWRKNLHRLVRVGWGGGVQAHSL